MEGSIDTKICKGIFWSALLVGCGSVFIAAPAPYDPSQCESVHRELSSKTQHTPIPIPFAGTRKVVFYMLRPDGWEEFEGTIHLEGLHWDVDWIKEGSLRVEHLTIAVLNNGEWETNPDVDITEGLSVIEEDGKLWVGFEATLKGKGVKPAGRQSITVQAQAGLCGEGRLELAESIRRMKL